MGQLTDDEQLAAILSAAEAMLACLPVVPSAPLAQAQQLVEELLDDDDGFISASPIPATLLDLVEAMAAVEWGFYPFHEFGTSEAYVDIFQLQEVADRLQKVKDFLSLNASCMNCSCARTLESSVSKLAGTEGP